MFPLCTKKGPYGKLSEFRYNNSRDGGRHPNYVFGWTADDRYYSIGITTNPPKKGYNSKFKYEMLHKKVDPNPKNKKPDYIATNNVHHNTVKSYGKIKEGWGFSQKDMPLVNSIIENHLQLLKKSNTSKVSTYKSKKKKKRKK